MKLGVVMVAIILIGDFIFMFPGLDLVLYIVGYLYVLYILLSRLTVLHSWCRETEVQIYLLFVYVLVNYGPNDHNIVRI